MPMQYTVTRYHDPVFIVHSGSSIHTGRIAGWRKDFEQAEAYQTYMSCKATRLADGASGTVKYSITVVTGDEAKEYPFTY